MAVVYLHRRNDTNEIFYIGIGRNKHRAGKKTNRNSYWNNIVNKYGFTKEILFSNISWEEAIKQEIRLINKYGFTKEILFSNIPWEEAIKQEIRLIKKYGRKDINKGILVNQTNGGEGRPSKEFQYDDLPYYTKEQLKVVITFYHPRN